MEGYDETSDPYFGLRPQCKGLRGQTHMLIYWRIQSVSHRQLLLYLMRTDQVWTAKVFAVFVIC
jgi:DNA-binding sugar fermentation-stimulating protein